jgi:transposase
MMGRREGGQGQFFYAFDLDQVVPSDHLVRQIDAVLDLSWVHQELAPYYSHTGRPSIDPVLMIRMLIVGYVFAIRSERRICAEVQVNLAYRWFCKLGIEDSIPNHSVFCRARHERFRESDALDACLSLRSTRTDDGRSSAAARLQAAGPAPPPTTP